MTKKQAVETLDLLAQLAYKNAKNSFTLPGIGKLVLVNRKASRSDNRLPQHLCQRRRIVGSRHATGGIQPLHNRLLAGA
jgi:hypothetical protein